MSTILTDDLGMSTSIASVTPVGPDGAQFPGSVGLLASSDRPSPNAIPIGICRSEDGVAIHLENP
jgi:hypothetical protein